MRKFGSRSRNAPALVWLGCAIFATSAANAASRVDFNAANDYYKFRGSNRVSVVEQFHMPLCQQRLRELDYKRSVAQCNFILKIFPNHPQALLLTIQACERWKSSRCVIEDYLEKAVTINPNASETYVLSGIYYQGAKQYPKAIDNFKTALNLNPNSTNAHYNIALSYMDTQQFDLANVHAHRAYALGATLPGLRSRLEKGGYWKPVEQDTGAPSEAKPATSDAGSVTTPATSAK